MPLSDKITSLEQLLAVKLPDGRYTVGDNYYDRHYKQFSSLPVLLACVEDNSDYNFSIRPSWNDRCPESMWWAVREALRIAHNIYKPSTSVIDWLRSNSERPGFPTNHFLHVSSEDDAMIAYTPDEQSGVADKQVRTTLGRYLKKHVMGISDAQVQRLEAAHRADLSGEFELVTGADIAKAYKEAGTSGVGSCMSHGDHTWEYLRGKNLHPTMVYDAPGFGLAMLRNAANRISARCLVWVNPDDPADKRMIRVYGDSMLERRLQRAGFKYKGLAGARLRLFDLSTRDYPHRVMMPYIDGLKGAQSDGTVNIVRRSDGLHMVTAEQKDQLLRLARADGILEQVAVQAKGTAGVADLRVLPDTLGQYVCALTGKTFNSLEMPSVPYLVRVGEPAVRASLDAVLGLREARYRPDGGGSFADTYLAPDIPVFEHRGETIVDTPEIRRYLGYVHLDATFYPDQAGQYARKDDLFLVRRVLPDGQIDANDANRVWVRHEDVINVIAHDPAADMPYLAMVHKSEAHPAWARVADHAGTRMMAAAGVKIETTESKRRVVVGVHEVVRLSDGAVTYSRNAMAVSWFDRTYHVRRADAQNARNVPRLSADDRVFADMLDGMAEREIDREVTRRWATQVSNRFTVDQAGTTIWWRHAYGGDAALAAAVQGLGENCTKEQVQERFPGTDTTTAQALANALHNHAILVSMANAAKQALAAVRAAATTAPDAPTMPYTPVTGAQLRRGDRVLVFRRYDRSTDPQWSNTWVTAMDANIGQVSEVESVERDGVVLRSADSDLTFVFPFCCLAPAEAEQPALAAA